MATISLPLSLDTERSFQAFMTGIEDDRVRSGLLQQPNIDASIREVILLVQDDEFLRRAQELVQKLKQMQEEIVQPIGAVSLTPPTANAAAYSTGLAASLDAELRKGGEELHQYLVSNYPHGVDLLTEYGVKAMPRAVPLFTAVSPFVAANAGAVVNAAVWANVAVATNAVVAAAVVVLPAVFVTTSAKPIPGVRQ